MKLTLRIWRQPNGQAAGRFADYELDNLSEDMSFLEMLDVLNEKLTEEGQDPIAFDHDCREGICGMCSLSVNGVPHGPEDAVTICQTHLRSFKDGEKLVIEPWRAKAFPVIKDLVTDRYAFDRIIQAGGFVSVRTGGTPDANAIPISKADADQAMDAATCIACGACVAACKNASANLFIAAKVTHLGSLPQGQVERSRRAIKMIEAADKEGFGACSATYSCEAVCPKEIKVDFIVRLNRDYALALLKGEKESTASQGGA